MRLFALCLLLFGSFASAQLAQGKVPENVADRAVTNWLKTKQPNLLELGGLPAEEVCNALPALLANPAPPEGTTVNIDDRLDLETNDELVKRYSYPASLGGERLEIIEVTLERDVEQELWLATRVGYNLEVPQAGVRQWLQTPTASWLFVAFSVLIVYLLAQPSFFRRWLVQGADVIRSHRRIVIGTLLSLYALFGFGIIVGANLPDSCGTAIEEVLNAAVTAVGATEAYGSLNVARAAVVTFYQNFGVVTLSLLFGSALLFGVPAYLISAASFFTQAIPFGLLASAEPLQLLFVIVLLLLELSSYFLVVAGGGILLNTLIRKGFGATGEAVRNLALMLPFALILLLIGAWYEAGIIILPQL